MSGDLKKCEEEFEKQDEERAKWDQESNNNKHDVNSDCSYDHRKNGENGKHDLMVNESKEPEESSGSAENGAEDKDEEEKKEESQEEKLKRLYREEKGMFQEVHAEIAKKNLRQFYINNVFSTDYAAFIHSLITNSEQTLMDMESVEKANRGNGFKQGTDMDLEKGSNGEVANGFSSLFEFICTAYFTTIIRMHDKKIQHQFFEWISDKMDKVNF